MNVTGLLGGIAALFLSFFLADGVFSLCDETLALFGMKTPVVTAMRALLAWFVVLYSGAMFLLIALTPRLKKRLLLPPILFVFWASIGACFPLPFLNIPHVGVYISGVQTLLGGILLMLCMRQGMVIPQRPAFTWGNLALGVGLSVILMACAVLGLGVTVAQAVEQATGGYVLIKPHGLFLEERVFRKGDKEVRLIGMIHLANAKFYDDLADDLKSETPSVVLLEGVTDEQNLLKNRLSYDRFAKSVGLTSQEKSSFTKQAIAATEEKESGPVEYRNADLDLSELEPQTIVFIEAVAKLFSSKSFDDVMTQLQDRKSPLNNEALGKAAFRDLIETRNEHLIKSVDEALGTSNLVIVPWGAAHMKDIQLALEEKGFTEVNRSTREAFLFFQRKVSSE